jgi:phosphoribosylformylglycinamidine synthase
MFWKVEVRPKRDQRDPRGEAVKSDALELGVRGVRDVRVSDIYVLYGRLSADEARRSASLVLVDPVVQDVLLTNAQKRPTARLSSPKSRRARGLHTISVFRKPGVMDVVALTTLKAMADIGIKSSGVKTGKRYEIAGKVSKAELRLMADEILHNAAIEDAYIDKDYTPPEEHGVEYHFRRVEVPLLKAGAKEMERISNEGQLSLNRAEMSAIQDYFRGLGRNPTDCELETLAQTWSEHCVHKTLKGIVEYVEIAGDGRKTVRRKRIDNLLKTTIARVTKELRKPWCVSVFKDNSGVIRFDDEYNVCFKVETHNHPSAIEPYGGANTGIGGVIRDPLGTGLGAKPILNTDIFCFGPPDLPHDKVPKGALHPKRVMKGVVAGVRDYGNRMGIPTANGAIFFDERYVGNPLVYCGNIGLIPRHKSFKKARKGDLILVIGGRTGRDGIHGATFSSVELHEESEVVSSGAVQIGNAITEKTVVDTLMQARDRGLYTCITDCGAGGLSSAVGEMGEALGAEVELSKVPLKYEGLSYTEIWISEAQERMVLAVPPEKEEEIHALFASEDVEATTIGRFTGDRRLRLRYQGNLVCDLDMEFLHHGIPRLERKAVWKPPRHAEPRLPEKKDYGEDLKKILSSWNVCSKEWVIRQYDHEVQGASVLKPLVGAANDGPGDACIIRPVLGSKRGLIVSCGLNPKYGDIDPYHMAASGIDEALRQIIAVGGNLDEVAILDNFCWGNTNKPDRLGGLVRAAQACYDVAKAYGVPFISGKDSLNNEFRVGKKTIAIPPTLLISAMAVMPDVTKAVSMDLKRPGHLIYIVGLTKKELGGSHYYSIHGHVGNDVPKVDTAHGRRIFEALSRAAARGLVRACHDCSEGGIAVAAAEMAFAGGHGMRIDLERVPVSDDVTRWDGVLFSESNSRFVVEIAPENRAAFESVMRAAPCAAIGAVLEIPILRITAYTPKHGVLRLIQEDIQELKECWQAPLRW